MWGCGFMQQACCVQQRSCFWNFRKVTHLSSRKIFEHTTDEGKGIRLVREKIRNHKPSDTASYPRRFESSNRLSLYVTTHLVVFCSKFLNSAHFQSKTEFHLSGIIGRASHPYMQKFRIIWCFFEKIAYIRSLSGTTILKNRYFMLHIYWRTNKILASNSLYVLFISVFNPRDAQNIITPIGVMIPDAV